MTGKSAMVVGGGRGIGRAIALRLAAQGARIALVARTTEELNEVASEIRKSGGQAHAFPASVVDQHQVRSAMDGALDRFERIDILVNAAGVYGAIGNTWELDVDDWLRAITVNLVGTLTCCQMVIPTMIAQGSGKIINITGGGATMPLPRLSSYACSKAAIVRLTETLAEELKSYNIQINSVMPGTVDTRIQDELLAAGEKAGPWFEPIKALRTSGGGVPMEKITSLIVRLLSADFDKLNGRVLSARYDDWTAWDKNTIDKIMASSMFTLRRMDSHSMASSFSV